MTFGTALYGWNPPMVSLEFLYIKMEDALADDDMLSSVKWFNVLYEKLHPSDDDQR